MFKYDDDYLLEKLNNKISEEKSAYCDHLIENEEILNNVFKHINIDNVICVLLRGSLACYRNNPYSDVDVVLITRNERISEFYFLDDNGIRYHLNIFNELFLNVNNKTETYRFFYGMRKIYDPNNVCDKLIEDIKEYIEYKSSLLQKQNNEVRDYLYELLEYMDSDDELLSKFVKAKILRESPTFLTNYNGIVEISSKFTIDCLLRDSYTLGLKFAKALDKGSGIKEIKEWLDAGFSELCNIDIYNLDFSKSKKSFEVIVNDKSMYDLYNDYLCFFKSCNYLKPDNTISYDFIVECKNKTPKLFEKLWSLIK